jgi:hypothetical protein
MQNKILNLFRNELTHHPQAQMVDFYKLLYQSVFGAGHFIKDEKNAWQFFEKEWAENQPYHQLRVQDITLYQQMYRVYFGIQKDIDKKDIFSAFLMSVRKKISFDWKEWINLWNQAEELLQFEFRIEDEKSTLYIKKTLLENQVVPTHSEIYRTIYQPHYRILDEEGYAFICQKTIITCFR